MDHFGQVDYTRFIMRPEEARANGWVPRLVHIDCANVIVTYDRNTRTHPDRSGRRRLRSDDGVEDDYDEEEVREVNSLVPLVALFDFFLRNDFDILGVLARRFRRCRVPRDREMVLTLEDEGLIIVNSEFSYDDSLLLQSVADTDGVVVSRDAFGVHKIESTRFAHVIDNNRVDYYMRDVTDRALQFKSPRETGACWVSDVHFEFFNPDGSGPSFSKFYSRRDLNPLYHDLVVQERENWSENKKKDMLEIFENYLTESFTAIQRG